MSAQPLIDPARQPDDALERTLGVKSGGQLSRETDRVRKADRSRLIVISTDPIDWYRANVGGSGDAAYGMRLGTPSSDSAWAMTNIPWPAPGPCRVLRLHLWSAEARTAGTATARLRVIEGGVTTDYTFSDCQLNATTTQIATIRIPWLQALRVAKGATIEGRIVTAGTFAPAPADMALIVVVGYEDEL